MPSRLARQPPGDPMHLTERAGVRTERDDDPWPNRHLRPTELDTGRLRQPLAVVPADQDRADLRSGELQHCLQRDTCRRLDHPRPSDGPGDREQLGSGFARQTGAAELSGAEPGQ